MRFEKIIVLEMSSRALSGAAEIVEESQNS
jgi:hypothetical protein